MTLMWFTIIITALLGAFGVVTSLYARKKGRIAVLASIVLTWAILYGWYYIFWVPELYWVYGATSDVPMRQAGREAVTLLALLVITAVPALIARPGVSDRNCAFLSLAVALLLGIFSVAIFYIVGCIGFDLCDP